MIISAISCLKNLVFWHSLCILFERAKILALKDVSSRLRRRGARTAPLSGGRGRVYCARSAGGRFGRRNQTVLQEASGFCAPRQGTLAQESVVGPWNTVAFIGVAGS